MELGYFLSCEEHGPDDLLRFAREVEDAGISEVWISDHFHPWTDRQGHSPFVWSVIGALAATTGLTVTTGVTCPTIRIHPAIIAQAAATSAVMSRGRFRLGVGSGENLNEHILGDAWPETDVRLEMLEEAIEVIRLLWEGGVQSHRGKHYTVQNARIYDLPEQPIDIVVSGFGPKATDLAAAVGDGFACTGPDAELVERFDAKGGEGKPKMAAFKVCYDRDEAAARKRAHEIWGQSAVPGELNQELPMPAHFEQAISLVTEDDVAESIVCGADPDRYLEGIREYEEAGFTHLYLQQIGPDVAGFLDFYTRELSNR
jgi:G6PDH family F420-dependent oxidoreductase